MTFRSSEKRKVGPSGSHFGTCPTYIQSAGLLKPPSVGMGYVFWYCITAPRWLVSDPLSSDSAAIKFADLYLVLWKKNRGFCSAPPAALDPSDTNQKKQAPAPCNTESHWPPVLFPPVFITTLQPPGPIRLVPICIPTPIITMSSQNGSGEVPLSASAVGSRSQRMPSSHGTHATLASSFPRSPFTA